ncbi:hypothetical protein EUX98_g125 [Antrodiella citrinella]|uniref:Uncharacterized protein n=1 Tax=Antrodiella citrinella TaxID=2447956 RepID=A0A4S4N772_9APHY|nr:hypothetical protein EUX98_g125 [Antrodiella citrinella]
MIPVVEISITATVATVVSLSVGTMAFAITVPPLLPISVVVSVAVRLVARSVKLSPVPAATPPASVIYVISLAPPVPPVLVSGP